MPERPVNISQIEAFENEVLYSLCPGPQTSYFSVAHGWTQEELAKVGAELTFLRSIPDTHELWPNIGHRSESLIREGSSHPPIWARADVSDTVLVAALDPGRAGAGQIIVRTDADIHCGTDLRGRRIGLHHGLNTRKLDFIRVRQHRGIVNALRLNGLGVDDVILVDLDHEKPTADPAARGRRIASATTTYTQDVVALSEDRIDAIFAQGAKTRALEATGLYRVIEDTGRSADWTIDGAFASLIAVSTRLAREHPEYIVAYLRAAIRGGRWVNENPRAAAELYLRDIGSGQNVDSLARDLAQKDFVPNLDPKNLAGIADQKRFLKAFSYIRSDFDVDAWLDSRFLQEALASFDDTEVTRVLTAA
jgi:ABC-type nitrate/sulfonate/bicarbonate transport system substrate-binding protein